jgi:hypothetical protein
VIEPRSPVAVALVETTFHVIVGFVKPVVVALKVCWAPSRMLGVDGLTVIAGVVTAATEDTAHTKYCNPNNFIVMNPRVLEVDRVYGEHRDPVNTGNGMHAVL